MSWMVVWKVCSDILDEIVCVVDEVVVEVKFVI